MEARQQRRTGDSVVATFRRGFAAFGEPVLLLDTDRRICWYNSAVDSLLGSTPGRLIGREFDGLILSSRTSPDSNGTISLRHASGRVLTVQTSNWVLRDGLGDPCGTACMLRDRTDEHRQRDVQSELLRVLSAQTLSGDEKIAQLLGLGCRFFRQAHGIVVQQDRNALIVQQYHSTLAEIEPGTRLALADRFCTETLADEKTVALSDTVKSGHGRHPACQQHGIRSYIGAPLYVDGALYGTLSFTSPTPREAFTATDLKVIRQITDAIGQELTQEKAIAALIEAANCDPLTGAATRRRFGIDLAETFEIARDQHGTSSLILFDIDRFKEVNDKHGHDMGDRVLQRVARKVQRMVGGQFPLYRIGGEEFALILPGVASMAAYDKAEMLRLSLATNTANWPEGVPVTVSFGIAELTPDMADEGLWIKQADRALYDAKASGRNCTQCRDGKVAQLRAASAR